MGRTPIRAKDSPGFIANRLARPFSLESLRMLGDGRRRRGDDRPRLPPRRRLPDGAVRADRPDRARRQPQRRPLLLRARAASPSAGGRARSRKRWSSDGQLGRKSGEGYYDYGDGPHRARRPRARASTAPTLDPGELARIDPAARDDPPPPLRPDRQRGRLRPRRGGRHSPPTWTPRCGSASTGRWARSSSPS